MRQLLRSVLPDLSISAANRSIEIQYGLQVSLDIAAGDHCRPKADHPAGKVEVGEQHRDFRRMRYSKMEPFGQNCKRKFRAKLQLGLCETSPPYRLQHTKNKCDPKKLDSFAIPMK